MAPLNRIRLRIVVALLLPWLVPGVVVAALWALPGDPIHALCPAGACTGQAALAEAWGLDGGPARFYAEWMGGALQGDLGRSWRVQQGESVAALLWPSMGWTALLVGLTAGVLAVAAGLTALGRMPRGLARGLRAAGLVPAVVAALVVAAVLELALGASGGTGWRLMAGILVLTLADGALGGTVAGTHALLERERHERYVRVALLRGEGALPNMLPNVLPTWVAQLRSRLLQLVSAAVVVEVVLGIPGLGELLFDGTLVQDFGVVLAAAWAVSVGCAGLLLVQAAVDVAVWRWHRAVPAELVGR